MTSLRSIRDPIHDLIYFDENNSADVLLSKLIDCREMQRLRRIKQLGLSEMVFPGANHSRFAHSIGAMHIAKMFLHRLDRIGPDPKLDNEQKKIVLVAALLHDVGHGPFSHAFEKISEESHEKRTREIIQDDSTEVNQALKENDPLLPQKVAAFFDEDASEVRANTESVPPYCVHIVSSQLDADRFDYLLRDSHATGTEYGRFDLGWLIGHLEVDKEKNLLYLNRKAFHAVEQYIFARYHMYQTVYYHKATRSAEVMLRLIFRRYKELLDKEGELSKKADVVENAPAALVKVFSKNATLGDYLLLDDHSITEFFKCCEISLDPILRRLAYGLLHRQLYKCVDATGVEKDKMPEFQEKIVDKSKEITKKFIEGEENGFPYDTPADTPYKVYDPTADKPETQIYVEDQAGKIKTLDQLSDQVSVLRNKITKLRYYFPAEARDEITPLMESWRKGN